MTTIQIGNKQIVIPAGDNIYTTDGAIGGNRVVTSAGFSTSFTGNGNSQWEFLVSDLGFESSILTDKNQNELYTTDGIQVSSIRTTPISSTMDNENSGIINSISVGNDMTVTDGAGNGGLKYLADYSANYTIRSLVDKEYVDSLVGSSIFDQDGNTGIQTERTPNDNFLWFQNNGLDTFSIDNLGRAKFSNDFTSPRSCQLEVGNGSEPSTFAVSAIAGYLNIVTYRDIDGENVFRTKGDIATGTLTTTFGDTDDAFGYGGVAFNTKTTGTEVDYIGAETHFRENFANPNYVGFKAPAGLVGSQVWDLPLGDGAVGQALVTDGAGKLSWANKTDICQLTNQAMVNMNSSIVGTPATWNVTANQNNNATLYTPTAGGVTITTGGLYKVECSLYSESTVNRPNIGLEIIIDGVPQSVIGAGGYIRNNGGHNESSTYITQIVSVADGETVNVRGIQLANNGVVTNPAGRSVLIITKI